MRKRKKRIATRTRSINTPVGVVAVMQRMLKIKILKLLNGMSIMVAKMLSCRTRIWLILKRMGPVGI